MTLRPAIILGLLAAAPATAGVVATVKLALANQPPRIAFDRQTPPPPPDYAVAANWAARPGTRHAADVAPRGVTNPPEAARRADVFYVPPTTYYNARTWNAAVPDPSIDRITDSTALRNQASVFGLCCRIWAPRYRQMALGGYTRWSADSEKASDLAYGDVARAFDRFLLDIGDRPFILAGHSQSSRHFRRLIAERIDGTPLARRMIAAYLPGTWIPQSYFTGLRTVKACTRPRQTQCIASWSTYAEGRDATQARIRFARTSRYRPEQSREPFVCTNPLSWRAGGETVAAAANPGGWIYGDGARPAAIDPAVVSMRCRDGAVYIAPTPPAAYEATKLPFIDYHNSDYNLAWMSIRQNAADRTQAWFATGSGSR